ncbi:MAG: FAD:protein FMN transferase [Anaerolineae bacterium]|nr:FAD:protein FMN transferase [Anaerolineae bacterium]
MKTVSRRDFLKITAAAGGLLAAGGVLGWKTATRAATVHATRSLMGTVINLTLVAASESHGRAAIEATFAEMQRLIACFDHRQPASLITQLNRQGRLTGAPPELIELLTQARRYSELSGGAFDVTVKPLLDAWRAGQAVSSAAVAAVGFRHLRLAGDQIYFERPGMAITLDGIAKGRVIDAATAVLQARGFANILVEAGGDLVGRGQRPDGRPWRVGVANPRDAGVLAVLPVLGQAVATSGDYINYFSQDFARHHIIDPRTGQSPAELASVSVLAPSATAADALSTAIMVLGRVKGLALAAQLPGVEALVITKTMQIDRTPGFPTA